MRMSIRSLSFLAVAAIFASAAGAQDPRIVETTSGIVGLARGQTALVNVVDDGSEGSGPLVAVLSIADGTSNTILFRTVTLTPGKMESLELKHDGRIGRMPVRAVVRLQGAPTDESRPFHVTFELVDRSGAARAVISCPNDFAFAGNPGGRGDVFNCTDCNVELVSPGT
jgi:hypothetical protein